MPECVVTEEMVLLMKIHHGVMWYKSNKTIYKCICFTKTALKIFTYSDQYNLRSFYSVIIHKVCGHLGSN
jgi:hypothetical protein